MEFVTGSTAGTAVATAKLTASPLLSTGKQSTIKVYSTEGTNTKLELVLSFIDKDANEIAPIDLSKFKREPWTATVDGVKQLKGVYWHGTASLPAGTRSDLVVAKVKASSKVDMEYINEIDVTAGDFHIHFTPNSWIHRENGGRVFFSSELALLPQDTPDGLKEWRQADLDDIKGSRVKRSLVREPWDRIYDYDVYNDLAAPDQDRPALGGSKEFPYPRRIRTGRPHVQGINGESYEVRDPQPFWVPLNDRFNERKQVNVLAYTFLGKVPAFVQKVFGSLTHKPLTSFKDVDELFAHVSSPVVGISDNEARDVLHEGDQKWTENPRWSSIWGSIEQISEQAGGWLQSVSKFPPPAIWQNRPMEWQKDEEWGRQALAGVNPCCIAAVTSAAQLGSITEGILAPHLEGHSLDALLSQSSTSPRLLVIDHTAVFEDYAERISRLDGRFGYSGRAVLFRRDDKSWVPVAVELKAGDDGEVDVYTPADHPNLWLLARGVFTSIDGGVHQLVSHWLRTHAVTEPFIISTRRNLSMLHPVFQLLTPHFAYTLQINCNARMRLIAANATIEKVFTPGEYALRMSSEVYKAVWRFDTQALPEDLVGRGLAVKEEGSLKLLLDDYPYADDGMLLWNSLVKWVDGYLRLYYEDNVPGKRIEDDSELTSWWKEILTVGHADKEEGWPALITVGDLTQILTTMIWIATGHHAAINYSQYPFSSYTPNRPSMCRKRIPKRDSEELQELISSKAAGEKVYLDTLMDRDQALQLMVVVRLLSSHPENEVYIGEPHHPYIRDDRALQLYGKFVEEIQEMEKTIEARNRDPERKMRTTPGLPYTVFDPTSKAGVTNRGVPQSITI